MVAGLATAERHTLAGAICGVDLAALGADQQGMIVQSLDVGVVKQFAAGAVDRVQPAAVTSGGEPGGVDDSGECGRIEAEHWNCPFLCLSPCRWLQHRWG